MPESEIRMIDIHAPKHAVQVDIKEEGKTYALWVNVDNICRLRIKGIPDDRFEVEVNGLNIL